ncbi:hypothetical protein ACJMK2_041693 [Sinanodonta woodiana]|uniref:EGF-like domain-containing protein n=1 Tax=Sinanodonta woodiana TaxID=1069815 RepID=A0ABD3W8Q2_SINWO
MDFTIIYLIFIMFIMYCSGHNILMRKLSLIKRQAVVDKSKICKALGCLNGVCKEEAILDFRIVCICNDGFEGKLCDIPICPMPCGRHGKCLLKNNVKQCECGSGYFGPTCNQTSNYELRIQVQTISRNPEKFISNFKHLSNKPTKDGQLTRSAVEKDLKTWIRPDVCAPGFECKHGRCDQVLLSENKLRCNCDEGWSGVFCDRPCTMQCQNNGYCYADRYGNQFCICPWGFTGNLCGFQRQTFR